MTDTATPTGTAAPEPQTGYAPVNGLQMYYEIHGAEGGVPLVVLHGAYMTIGTMGAIVPGLAATRQVIAVELQAHGHTADIDRPITYAQLADDTAALIRHLGIARADVFGYSLGGGVALQLTIRHSALVRKLVAVSASFTYAGMHPELLGMIESITPEMFAGSPFEAAYLETAPNPESFPTLVEKLVQLDSTPYDWGTQSIAGITAPTFVIIGDSDAIIPDHAVQMFRLLGGGVMGDLAGLPRSRLAVLPATTHVGVIEKVELLLAMVPEFLDAPVPEAGPSASERRSDASEGEGDDRPRDPTPSHDRTRLARACYDAYVTGDRQALESLIADDFAFWSPQDDGIDRATYFERCWPASDTLAAFELKRLHELGDEVIVTYEAERNDGSRFRNTEVLTFTGDRLTRVEVYFGWNL